MNVANDMLLTGARLDAQRAYELGLVNYLTEDPTARAWQVARAVTESSREVQQAIFELRGFSAFPEPSSLADMPSTTKLLAATKLSEPGTV